MFPIWPNASLMRQAVVQNEYQRMILADDCNIGALPELNLGPRTILCVLDAQSCPSPQSNGRVDTFWSTIIGCMSHRHAIATGPGVLSGAIPHLRTVSSRAADRFIA